ncbi:rod shape-determining protein MreD [Adlercreutzia shanghongiae]|uniref:Rod shape-determining protein MreD n=1 Tax=Adlercreutzia shanghongiae TaxID=3111773 RepID=A0ABU6IXC8_9ACTN|nr:rod shape-determining protein MreD [Adlercreutzia sp. R22]MEC4294516.1 rod shape-determining protein MreD [Adlercreutzia sp. R22]
MEITRENVAGAIGAIVAVLLQIAVAPAITLFEAVPNFIVAFCIVRAVATSASSGSAMPLILGLLFDLMGGGPVGAMAFVLVLVTFLASRLFMALNNDTLFMPVAIMLLCIVLVEVMYLLIVMVCGADVPMGDAFLYRTLPCMLYDCVIGLLMYPLAVHVMVDRPRVQPGTPQLR